MRSILAAMILLAAPLAHAEPWAIPHFFEVGPDVYLPSGAGPVDTTRWPSQALGRDNLTALGDEAWRIFTYREVGRQYALFVPRGRPCSSNGRTTACWEPSADAFNFGVERSRTVGNLVGGDSVIRHLAREIQPGGASVNVQSFQLAYAVEGTGASLREHKGLIPGLPVSFDRFDLEPGAGPTTLVIGLVPTDAPAWAQLESLTIGSYRVLLAADAGGALYFLAAPLALLPSWYFGDVASDLVVEAVGSTSAAAARHQKVAALFVPEISAGTVLSGRVAGREELGAHLEQATAFLTAHDAALADFRAHGADGPAFLRHYTHTFLESHRSHADPRALTAKPYGDQLDGAMAPEPGRGIRYGSDQGRALLGLVGYQRKSNDPSVVQAMWDLTAASMEAMTPQGAVWRGRFDEMLVATEADDETGRADVLVDNGGVAVTVNHPRLVVGSGTPRAPGATWGPFSMVIDDRPESVADYAFAIDTMPETVRDHLNVGRLFTRRDGALQVRETVSLSRGIPAARVDEAIENRSRSPRFLAEVRLTLADFLHYGDGRTEAGQNRYGLSATVEGVRQPVGLWMEGMSAPLWGDAFASGWVDLTALYNQHRSRFVVVYGYEKAAVYYLPQAADGLVAYNATTDGYRGWTTLQARYRVGHALAPGATYRSPSVYSYLMRAPLFSADADTVPDVLQSLTPLWTDLVQGRPHNLLHTNLEPDDTSVVVQAAWMASADRMAELAARAGDPEERRELERRANVIRENALRGARDTLSTLTALRGRSDLMPAYGIGSNYGFHVLVFDWAYRATGDARFREALLLLANEISAPEGEGGLQITDSSKPNHGGYILNPRARAQGSNNLDDQGIKLWALRVAYERTMNPRYRRSAELFIDHWVKVRPADHQFFGTTRLFDRYRETGPAEQTSALGQTSLLIGLRAWADLHPAAARLHAEGLKNFTERHPVDAVGTTGVLDGGTSSDPNVVQFGTSTEVGGTFLMALTFDPASLKGRWPAPRRPPSVSAVVKGKPEWHAPGG